MFLDYGASLGHSSLQYYMIVSPIIVYSLFNINMALGKRVSSEVLSLLLFLLLALIFSIIKFDIKAVFNLLIWTLPIIIILNSKVFLSIRLVNTLFILTIVVGVFAYHNGINVYGYLPGQSNTNLHQGLWWRVSMFPYSTPPATAFFSIIVLVLNLLHNKIFKWKMFFMILSTYFMVLSGSRTALIAIILILMILLISKLYRVKMKIPYKVLAIMPLLIFFIIFFSPELMLKINFSSPFINSLIFRSIESSNSIDAILQTMNRQTVWEQYIYLYTHSPIIGVDTVKLRSIGQSETMLLSFLAWHGISVIFLLSYMYFLITNSLTDKNYLRYSLGIIFILYMITYSSFFQTYNFLFLLLLGLLNFNENK